MPLAVLPSLSVFDLRQKFGMISLEGRCGSTSALTFSSRVEVLLYLRRVHGESMRRDGASPFMTKIRLQELQSPSGLLHLDSRFGRTLVDLEARRRQKELEQTCGHHCS